eukprot:Rmarinus@m.18968
MSQLFAAFRSLFCCCGFLFQKQQRPAPVSRLDSKRCSKGLTVSNFSVLGKGTVLADSVLEQDRTYFEVKVVQSGFVSVGVAQREVRMSEPLSSEPNAWVHQFNTCEIGDVISCIVDQSGSPRLRFWLNGKEIEHSLDDYKGPVYPAVYLDCDALVEVNLGQIPFAHSPPSGFMAPIPAMDLL